MNPEMSAARLQEIRDRLAAATPGPWAIKFHAPEDTAQRFVSGNNKANAALINNAATDLAWLLGEVERLMSSHPSIEGATK